MKLKVCSMFVSCGLMGGILGWPVTAESGPSFGDPLPKLTHKQLESFEDGKVDFEEEEEIEDGLGPVFNDFSCAACHSNPAVGGDSDITEDRFGTTIERNGKKTFDAMEHLGGALRQSQGIGQVGKGCIFLAEKVPPEATIHARRKTTSLFGLGLVDAVPDSTFKGLARLQKILSPKTAGRPSMVKNLSTGKHAVGKFGWKGQHPTLFQFGADAYLNEMGITSPLFPDENCPQGDCDLLTKCLERKEGPDDDGSGVEAFDAFMTFLAPPPRGTITPQVQIGELVFTKIGCANCHVSTLKTESSPIEALNQVTFYPYSDFLLHDVGTGDGIVQGDAAGNELRTPPLWGLRVRKTFLHDASERTIEGAIRQHGQQGQDAKDAFEGLSDEEHRALMAFLKSL